MAPAFGVFSFKCASGDVYLEPNLVALLGLKIAGVVECIMATSL